MSFTLIISMLFFIIASYLLIQYWYPAKVFMGDTGSLFLGFIIAVLALLAFKYVSPTSILFFAAMLIYMQVTFSLMFVQIHHQDDFLNLLTFVILFLVFFNLFDPRIRRRPKTSFVHTKLKNKETQNV